MPSNKSDTQDAPTTTETTRSPALEPTPDSFMPDSFAHSVVVNPEHGEIKRIDDPEERNGGVFRPILKQEGKPDLEVSLEDVVDSHVTQFEGDGLLLSRPEWELPKSKPMDDLYVTTEPEL